MNDRPTRRHRRWTILAVTYLVTMAALVAALFHARAWVLENLGDEVHLRQWRQWVAAERQRHEDGSGPVERKIPTADGPPLLILMEESFPGVLLSVMLIATVLFALVVLVTTTPRKDSSPMPPSGTARESGE